MKLRDSTFQPPMVVGRNKSRRLFFTYKIPAPDGPSIHFWAPALRKSMSIQRERKRAERLNRIDRKQNAALRAKRADRFEIDAIAAAKIRARQRHQFCPRRQSLLDNFRRDLTDPRGLEQDRLHPVPFKREPGINIRRIIIEIADDFVAAFPIESVRDCAQPARSGSGERNLIQVRADESRHRASRLRDMLQLQIVLPRIARGAFDRAPHRVGHAPRQRRIRSVGAINLARANRKFAPPQFFVRVERGDQAFFSARSPCSINFQNSRALPSWSSSAIGSLLRKRKSRNVFLCRTR